MEIRNGFSFRTAIRAWWHVAALGCLSLSAHAQSDFGQKIWWKADHNSLSAEVARSLGTPSATYPAAGAPSVNGARISNLAGAWPTAAMKTNLPVPGKSAAIDVIARVKPASVGAAFGRLATKVGPVSNVVALVAFAAEVGYIIKGDGTMEKPDPNACTVAPCYEYRATATSGGVSFPSSYRTSRDAAATEAVAALAASFGRTVCTPGTTEAYSTTAVLLPPAGASSFNWRRTTSTTNCNTNAVSDFNSDFIGQIASRTRTPDTATTIPATGADLETAVAGKPGFSTTSAISAAIAEAIKNGEVIEYDPAAVSGPASKPGNSSTTNNPDGTVTTVSVTHNYTYNGPKVTVTTATTTTTVNPATGATTTTTKTDAEAVPDTPPVEEEKNPCDLNPDALGCAELDTPSEEIPRDTETISYAEENVFGSGSCPANLTANVATLGRSMTVWDWSKTCELALPLRALVLGLASFAALLIVMPGDNKT